MNVCVFWAGGCTQRGSQKKAHHGCITIYPMAPPPPPPPYGSLPQEDSGGCHLISENYAYALQLILGFAALAGLVVSCV